MNDACPRKNNSCLPRWTKPLDQACDRFEAAWIAAGATVERPRIEDYLSAAVEAERSILVTELVYLDIYYRRLHGEHPQLADYDTRFPDLDQNRLASALVSRNSARPDRALTCVPRPHLAVMPVEPLAIPGYEIVGVLGRGGMGVILEAWQIGLKRRVALKMIRDQAVATAKELARFATEAEAVARLQHPNIVQIYEIGEHAGRPFFSLELLTGGSLDKRLAGAPLAAGSAALLVETLARAVHYAHQRGILHRDLKPANVLLTAEGVPKIADFGLAKLTAGGSGDTQSGTVLGTPSYIAPEQARGQTKDLGPPVDIYALGAILYETLTGRPPFRAETPLETMRQVQAEEPVSVVRLQPKVPRDLNTICLKCLEKEAHKRYATAEALADDLRRFLAAEPIQARPVRIWERGVKWAKRRPAVAALLGVSGLAALALVGVGVGLWYSGQLVTAIAEANKQRAEAERLRAEAEDFQLRVRYSRDMNLAQQAFEGECDWHVLDLLNGLRPRPGQPDLRGFEWYHLWQQLHRGRFTWRQPTTVYWTGFAPDSKTVATMTADGTVRLWDVATGEQRATVSCAPAASYPSLAFRNYLKTVR